MPHTAVYGIYSSRQDAEMAIDSMRSSGFRPADISVLLPENEGTKDIGHEKHTKAPEKATAGAAIAGVAGGAIGWLIGAGALAIPGVGPLLAAGPIMAALAGVGAGSVVGGLTGALIGAGIPEYEAKRYEGRIRSGGILLSVHCEDDLMVNRAKDLLRHTGAQDIAAAQEARVPGGARHRDSDDRDAERRLDDRAARETHVVHEPVDHHLAHRDVVDRDLSDHSLRDRDLTERDLRDRGLLDRDRTDSDLADRHLRGRDTIGRDTIDRDSIDDPRTDRHLTRDPIINTGFDDRAAPGTARGGPSLDPRTVDDDVVTDDRRPIGDTRRVSRPRPADERRDPPAPEELL